MINTNDLPSKIDEAKTYVVAGKTMSRLCALGRRKWNFSQLDFTTKEDDHVFTVSLKGSGDAAPSNPYVMGTNRTTTDPTPADDTWDINDQEAGRDGVQYDTVRWYDEGTVAFSRTVHLFTRTITNDALGRTVAVSAEDDLTLTFDVTGP